MNRITLKHERIKQNFKVESTDNIIKIPSHSTELQRMNAFGKDYHLQCLLSQSVIHQVLDTSDDVF